MYVMSVLWVPVNVSFKIFFLDKYAAGEEVGDEGLELSVNTVHYRA
jgi:hypothetical protein